MTTADWLKLFLNTFASMTQVYHMLICTSYTSEHFQVKCVLTGIAFCFLNYLTMWYWKEIGSIWTFEWWILADKPFLKYKIAHTVYKVGNNILSNQLSCLNRKLQLDFLNLPFETNKIKCKNLFLLWTVLIVFCWLFYKFILFCSFCYDVVYALMKEQ